ncbi:MAG: glycosyltransferase family 1 protein [Acidimicrobiales bacterium]
MTAPRVIFDLVAVQSPSYKGRGIARYSADFARAMVRRHPDMVSSIAVHPEVGPLEGVDDLTNWLTTTPDWSEASILHLSSVFEPEVPVRVFWPRQATAHGLLTAVTLYDLIPDVFPGWYLEDPGLRRRWRSCREVVRAADAVLTLSESAKQDTVALLGVPERRVSVVGSGISEAFRRPESRLAALEIARRGVEGLEPGFVLYQGAFNRRKNVDGLVEAYALLPHTVIERHQLVIACDAAPLTRNHYLVMAERLGLEGRILISGYVPEEVLVSLYQSTDLAVYPSLYEGFGLPVLESMACGAPTIAGDNSSLREILPREARFEPSDPEAITQAMARGLTDTAFRARLAEIARQEPPSWDAVADKAATAFEALAERWATSRPSWRRRPYLALVGTPPELGDAMRAFASYDWFCTPGQRPERGFGALRERLALSYNSLAKIDSWRGGYDAVVGWAPTADEPALSVVEELRAAAFARRAVISDWEARGLKVVAFGTGPGWETTAAVLARRAWDNLVA